MNDFDFLAGSWNVTNRRLVERLTGSDTWEEFPSTVECLRQFDGAANVDFNDFPTKKIKGMSLRVYDPARQEWSIYWVSDADGVLQPAVVGRFENGVGTFFGDDTLRGQPIRVRFVWSDMDTDTPRWEQAFSADGGENWEINWVMEFRAAVR
ncbi:hypothetical protein [Actinoplanes solisilvae]|uniref:hypothetical protein n=1 Tax=Actinoplanes solisilvae TaxID=2486853 RepID=UPI000FDB839E|nr:hypothetical protein [Actinoplanes solisilvae]